MSLKAFHIFFISVAVILAFGFALWAYRAFASRGEGSDLFLALGSTVAGIGLILYEARIIKKLKHVRLL